VGRDAPARRARPAPARTGGQDHLTGLLNRNGFRKAADREHALAGRTGAPLALALLDLDGFKDVNDQHGHAAGDRMLCELAEAWSRTLRPGDLLARMGGDEFAVLFPATAAADVDGAIARLHEAHHSDWSAGVTEWKPGEPLRECFARADRHLYEAKATRRAPRLAVSSVRA
jgi:diguanylate cyclase (GGDEF)-like protein